ncbi:MAG TPA: hypothetical protein GYA10_12910 [Alphaproteobacteria bacterium]|nr:hypothetical protein [Alphaproteobacteria bacterium]
MQFLCDDGEWLVRDGGAVMFSWLQDPETATLVRSRRGKLSMSDGSYVETKEHVGGVAVLEARNRDEALAMVLKSPVARIGTLELRAADHVALIGSGR